MRRLADDRGIALVMALGVLVVLTMATLSLLAYTSENVGTVRYQKARVSAYSLAEAGVNEALAVLNLPTNNPLEQCLLSDPAPPCLQSPRTSTYGDGTAQWYGHLDEPSATWLITSTGAVANPSGPAAVTRRLTVHAVVVPASSQPLSNQAWNYIYAYAPNDGLYNPDGTPVTCEMTINNSGNIATSVFVEGDLCLQNSTAIVEGPHRTTLVVKGRLVLASAQNSVGASSVLPIDEVYVGNGCKLQNNAVSPSPCSAADKVWAHQYDTTLPDLGSPPVPDWSGWYNAAAPGPKFPCVASKSSPSSTWPTFDNNGVLNRGGGSVATAWNLTPTTAYDCWTAGGELAWNPATKALTVNGTVFIDGSAYIDSGSGAAYSYTGMGALYLSGVFLLKNSKLCAVLLPDGSDCDNPNWNPNVKALFVVADGNGDTSLQVQSPDSIQIKSSHFQGGLFGTNAIDIGTTSWVDGPMVGSTVSPGQSTNTDFPTISFVPSSTPGNQIQYSTVNPPTGYDG